MTRCKWCKRFVRKDQPAFAWFRTFRAGHFDGDLGWFWAREPLGWTEPQILCPECAESAANWPACHSGIFAEVGP